MQEALLHAFESETDIEFDDASLNPHYSYADEHNHVHQVWMLDAVTAYNQLRASERLGVQGTMLFRLGHSDTSIWPIWDATRPDDAMRQKLKDIPPGPDLILEGNGDVWRFVDTPKRGKRTFHLRRRHRSLHRRKLRSNIRFPTTSIRSAPPRKSWQSLSTTVPIRAGLRKFSNILKEKNVPAAFFVIGVQASENPGNPQARVRRRPRNRQSHLHASEL